MYWLSYVCHIGASWRNQPFPGFNESGGTGCLHRCRAREPEGPPVLWGPLYACLVGIRALDWALFGGKCQPGCEALCIGNNGAQVLTQHLVCLTNSIVFCLLEPEVMCEYTRVVDAFWFTDGPLPLLEEMLQRFSWVIWVSGLRLPEKKKKKSASNWVVEVIFLSLGNFSWHYQAL